MRDFEASHLLPKPIQARLDANDELKGLETAPILRIIWKNSKTTTGANCVFDDFERSQASGSFL